MIKVIGWIDYDNFNFATAEATEDEINAVVENIKENNYKFGGNDHENYSNCCPLLSNGKALRLSWRNWGLIMAKAYNLKTEDGKYNYILWYMGEYGPEKRVLPKFAPIDLNGCPKGKTFIYELSDEEFHAANNAQFTALILPVDFYNKTELKTLDEIIFKYKDAVVLETFINETKFAFYNANELFVKDEFLQSYPAESSNLMDFSEAELKKFIKSKYNTDSDNFISICFDISSDKRDSDKIYI